MDVLGPKAPPTAARLSEQALSDVDKEGREIRARDREVVIDGNGLVTLCPDLGYYEGSIEGSRHWGAMDHGDERDDQLYPSMQVCQQAQK